MQLLRRRPPPLMAIQQESVRKYSSACQLSFLLQSESWLNLSILPIAYTHHTGSLSWNGDFLCSGSRDHSILQWDPRSPVRPTRRLIGHTQEVCGLKWSPDHQLLASGGNDNKVRTYVLPQFCPKYTYQRSTLRTKLCQWLVYPLLQWLS